MIRTQAPEIHLDTSFLIRALVPGSDQDAALRAWIREGRPVSMSTLAWGEFLCGPLEQGVGELAERVIRRHAALGTTEAAFAAELFNETGRRRGSFSDCVIAATTMIDAAALATTDRTDFERFLDAGLELVG